MDFISDTNLKWDGSCLGTYTKTKLIINREKYSNLYSKYTLDINGKKLICLGSISNNTDACIIDEIKIFFNLEKIGTHWIKLGNSKQNLILYNLENISNYIKTIDKYNDKYEIQKIYVFKIILYQSYNTDKYIRLNNNNNPIIIKDSNINISNYVDLSTTIRNKWFGIETICDITAKMFNVVSYKQIPKLCDKMNTKLENTINRIDNREISIKTFIVSRLQTLLSVAILTDNNVPYLYSPGNIKK